MPRGAARVKPRYASNAEIFEKRGDSWSPTPPKSAVLAVSPNAAEAELRNRGYDRRYPAELASRVQSRDDPDMDQFTRATKAGERHEMGPSDTMKARKDDKRLRLAQVMNKLHRSTSKSKITVVTEGVDHTPAHVQAIMKDK